jgi:hypothetical protein
MQARIFYALLNIFCAPVCELNHTNITLRTVDSHTPDDETVGERAMSFQPAKRRYFPADIEPVIAIAEATRWEREAAVPLPTSKPISHDLMKQARIMRSAYQRELMRRFVELMVSWLYSPRVSRATAKAQCRDNR